MSVATNKEILCINQTIGQKIDTIMCEEDFVVPDIKPDILNTIQTNGTVCIYKKEVMDGKIKIEGSINTYIMYLADDEKSSIRSLNTTLNFTQLVDFDLAKEGMILEDKIKLKSMECRLINGRKINIKAMLDLDIKVLSNENVEFVREIEEIKDIQILNKTLKINTMLGSGNTKVYAKDTFIIDNIDNLMEIMKADFTIINRETKISYNKVLVKADACVRIVYLTEDNRICSVSNLIPVMGFIDIQDVTDENLCDVKYEIENLVVKPNNIEEHSIYIEAEIGIRANVYQEKELSIIEDLYSPSVNLTYTQRQIQATEQKEIIRDIYSIREKQFISEIGIQKIYDVDVKILIQNQTILKDRVLYEGEIELNFLFENKSSSNVGVKNITLPFNYNMECIGATPTSKINTNIDIVLQDFVIMPDENIDIKLDLEFFVNVLNNEKLQLIEEINIDENRENEKFSLVIYFVKPGDSLWNIAKKFKSTVANIATLNNIEDENKINIGQQLFIPLGI